jgi:hypothetical protein
VSIQVGVSNTEVQQANACEGAWSFGFHPEMNYQVRNMGVARTRGILGHSALEIFYKGLKDERDYDDCATDALAFIQAERVKELAAGDYVDVIRLELLNYLYEVLTKYFEHYQDDVENWEILDVEAFFATEQTGEVDFYLPSRLDLVIYQRSGKFAGETSPVDHKFPYDFWKRSKFLINSQLPLYILALRAARYAGKPKPVVRRAIVNQIRTRPLKNPQPYDLFNRVFEPYSTVKIQNVFQNHMKSAVRLAYMKRMPYEEALEEIKFAFGSMACDYCDFKDLCDITFEGNDPSDVIAATLKPNEYGYPPLEVIRRERN